MKVVIIGGGVIGLCSAYYLQKDGHDVTVIEKGGITKLGIREGHDIENIPITGYDLWYFFTLESGLGTPYLDVRVRR